MADIGWMETVRLAIKTRKFPGKVRRGQWNAAVEFARLVERLTPDDIVIDCGANIGRFTRMLASTGATVYAFEPDPYCFARLTSEFALMPNVRLSNSAVGVSDQPIELYRVKDFETNPKLLSSSSTIYPSKRNVDSEHRICVQQVDLVAFVRSLPKKVTLLKIDIEGAEVPIFEKLLDSETIARIGHVFAETHERAIPELAARTRAIRKRILAEGRTNINLDWK
jgi:FkbM family methyltransferase